MKYACPCWGYLTIDSEPPGSYDICPVCWWEDDPVQFDEPAYSGGANRVSLETAKRNFAAFGASDEEYRGKVRAPHTEEVPTPTRGQQ